MGEYAARNSSQKSLRPNAIGVKSYPSTDIATTMIGRRVTIETRHAPTPARCIRKIRAVEPKSTAMISASRHQRSRSPERRIAFVRNNYAAVNDLPRVAQPADTSPSHVRLRALSP
jgi:hypothetical protein